jgi:hypothetical protein
MENIIKNIDKLDKYFLQLMYAIYSSIEKHIIATIFVAVVYYIGVEYLKSIIIYKYDKEAWSGIITFINVFLLANIAKIIYDCINNNYKMRKLICTKYLDELYLEILKIRDIIKGDGLYNTQKIHNFENELFQNKFFNYVNEYYYREKIRDEIINIILNTLTNYIKINKENAQKEGVFSDAVNFQQMKLQIQKIITKNK